MKADALRPRLPSGVQFCGVTYEEAHAPTWRGWLSRDERARLDSFGAASRRRDFLAGRAAARTLLGDVLGMEPAEVPLHRAEDEAVDVGTGNWHLSIAHSDDHALAVCARHPLGVDLEKIQPRNPGIADFLFHPDDRGAVENLPYTESASLILSWVLKEAVLKARRSGFRTSPKALQLSVHPDDETAGIRVEGGGAWHLVYARLDGYWAAIATPRTEGAGA